MRFNLIENCYKYTSTPYFALQLKGTIIDDVCRLPVSQTWGTRSESDKNALVVVKVKRHLL